MMEEEDFGFQDYFDCSVDDDEEEEEEEEDGGGGEQEDDYGEEEEEEGGGGEQEDDYGDEEEEGGGGEQEDNYEEEEGGGGEQDDDYEEEEGGGEQENDYGEEEGGGEQDDYGEEEEEGGGKGKNDEEEDDDDDDDVVFIESLDRESKREKAKLSLEVIDLTDAPDDEMEVASEAPAPTPFFDTNPILSTMKDILPDADPDFLQMKMTELTTDAQLHEFILSAVTDRNYPKINSHGAPVSAGPELPGLVNGRVSPDLAEEIAREPCLWDEQLKYLLNGLRQPQHDIHVPPFCQPHHNIHNHHPIQQNERIDDYPNFDQFLQDVHDITSKYIGPCNHHPPLNGNGGHENVTKSLAQTPKTNSSSGRDNGKHVPISAITPTFDVRIEDQRLRHAALFAVPQKATYHVPEATVTSAVDLSLNSMQPSTSKVSQQMCGRSFQGEAENNVNGGVLSSTYQSEESMGSNVPPGVSTFIPSAYGTNTSAPDVPQSGVWSTSLTPPTETELAADSYTSNMVVVTDHSYASRSDTLANLVANDSSTVDHTLKFPNVAQEVTIPQRTEATPLNCKLLPRPSVITHTTPYSRPPQHRANELRELEMTYRQLMPKPGVPNSATLLPEQYPYKIDQIGNVPVSLKNEPLNNQVDSASHSRSLPVAKEPIPRPVTFANTLPFIQPPSVLKREPLLVPNVISDASTSKFAIQNHPQFPSPSVVAYAPPAAHLSRLPTPTVPPTGTPAAPPVATLPPGMPDPNPAPLDYFTPRRHPLPVPLPRHPLANLCELHRQGVEAMNLVTRDMHAEQRPPIEQRPPVAQTPLFDRLMRLEHVIGGDRPPVEPRNVDLNLRRNLYDIQGLLNMRERRRRYLERRLFYRQARAYMHLHGHFNVNRAASTSRQRTEAEEKFSLVSSILFGADPLYLRREVAKLQNSEDIDKFLIRAFAEEDIWNTFPGVDNQAAKKTLESKLKILMKLLPEASPTFLRRECAKLNSDEELQEFASKILQCHRYPKRKNSQPQKKNIEVVSVETSSSSSLNTMYVTLEDMLPDADPDFLYEQSKKFSDPSDLESFVLKAVEEKSYPKRDQLFKRREYQKLWKKYIENFNIKEFLLLYPNPIKYFYMEKKNSKNPMDIPLKFLLHRYRSTTTLHCFGEVYSRTGHSLTKTCDRLDFQFSLKPRMLQEWDGDAVFSTAVLQEIAFIQNRKEIAHYLLFQENTKAQAFAKAKEEGTLQECGCCYDEKLPEDMMKCNTDHSFCKTCVKRGSDVVIGNGGTKFPCYADGCEDEFPLSEIQNLLTPEVFSRLLIRKQYEEVSAAGIPGLETCPFCEFCSIPPPEDKLFRCLNPSCMKITCRKCKKLDHLPLSCEEFARKETQHKMQNYVEEQMTEALVRTCWQCGAKFVKESGCNMMSCKCGAKMCYICRKPIKDYNHFSQSGCGQNVDTTPQDEINVRDVGKRAKEEIEAANPGVPMINDPTKLLELNKTVHTNK